jgi:hypothetical protein
MLAVLPIVGWLGSCGLADKSETKDFAFPNGPDLKTDFSQFVNARSGSETELVQFD